MKRALFAIALAFVLWGCTAVTDFGKFTVGDAASVDLRASDGSGLPGFAEPCVAAGNMCDPGAGGSMGRVLMCITQFGPIVIPDGVCTRTCDSTSSLSCTDYPDSFCPMLPFSATSWCAPRCHPGRACRAPLECCNMGMVATEGVCVPRCGR